MDLNKYCLLESLNNEIRYTKEYVRNDIYRLYIKKNEIELLEKYLAELEQIKNTNPSEALKLFEEFKGILLKNIVFLDTDLQRLNTIKQYILKSQEQEKVLKIIKEKYVHIPQLLYAFENQLEEANPLEFYYNGQVGINVPMPLTEEEFDLLKEYLK